MCGQAASHTRPIRVTGGVWTDRTGVAEGHAAGGFRRSSPYRGRPARRSLRAHSFLVHHRRCCSRCPVWSWPAPTTARSPATRLLARHRRRALTPGRPRSPRPTRPECSSCNVPNQVRRPSMPTAPRRSCSATSTKRPCGSRTVPVAALVGRRPATSSGPGHRPDSTTTPRTARSRSSAPTGPGATTWSSSTHRGGTPMHGP